MRKVQLAILAALLFGGAQARAAGYEFNLVPQSAATYTGITGEGTGCTSGGTFNGQAVPQCTTADGGFVICQEMLGAANATSSFLINNIDVAKETAATTGNICYQVSAATLLSGVPMAVTSLTWGTPVFKSSSVSGVTSGTKPIVSLGATTAVTPSIGSAATACSGSNCNQHMVCFYFQFCNLSASACSTACTGQATSETVDVVAISVSAQP